MTHVHGGPHLRAAILAVGDELTLGQTADTNSAWLAHRLHQLGILAVEFNTVPDNLARHSAALRRLADVADLVIGTGGLGPTADDLTRPALAQAMDDHLVEDMVALAQVEAFFAARGRPMPDINRAQAQRPSRGRSLANLHGTAPGLWGIVNGVDVFCLPGPPGEMKPMFEQQVVPRLRPDPGRVVRTRALHCFGIGESDAATRLGAMMARTSMPLVGTTASAGVVSVRLRFEGPATPADADAALDLTERDIRTRLGEFIFGQDEDRLPSVVLALLRTRGETLACVESCSGGLLASMLTDIPGSSSAFLGGIVAYANPAKSALVGVDPHILEIPGPGAVSAECAAALALGGLERLRADHALAITGIAGPDGAVPARDGVPAKPVGTVFIARAARDQPADVRRFEFPGDRAAVRRWSALTALAMLRFHLAGLPTPKLLRQVSP
ncbi:MAG: putative competence-damage inducible protein [Phycisphaerae bacterium]|nr:MAG: putative competence-damage inducible protein [Phycisphaerae bacterium]